MRVDVLACNDCLEAKLSIRDFDSAEWRKQFPAKEPKMKIIEVAAEGDAREAEEDTPGRTTLWSHRSYLSGRGHESQYKL